jgi:hypothetical protein
MGFHGTDFRCCSTLPCRRAANKAAAAKKPAAARGLLEATPDAVQNVDAAAPK